MADRQFMVLVRFDVESFRWDSEAGCVKLYPANREMWDQTQLLTRIVQLLDSHGARGAFAVAYDILKRRPDMLRPILESPGKHEITWHLHFKWDPSFTEDWGEEPRSCYLGGYSEEELNRVLDLVHATFERAVGFQPKINLNACLSVNTTVLKVLEQRGYQVQGDYSANTDYRVMECCRQYQLEGREPFSGGTGGPCYPYAPDNIYRPNRWDGMLLGSMKLVEVPVSQFTPGRGDGRQDTFRNPDAEIASILRLYDRGEDLTTCAMLIHPFKMASGPNPGDIREEALADLDRVLKFVSTLPSQRFVNYMEAAAAYIVHTPDYTPGKLEARDAANGVLAYDGSSALKFHAIGSVEETTLSIGQENGVAQWVFEGVSLGPEIEPKLEDRVYYRPAAITADFMADGALLGLPRKNLQYIWQVQEKILGVNLVDQDSGAQLLYVLHENDAVSLTALPKEEKLAPVFTTQFSPEFGPHVLQPGRAVLKHRETDLFIELRMLRQQDGEWVSADVEPEVESSLCSIITRFAAFTSTHGPWMLVALPFLVVPENKNS